MSKVAIFNRLVRRRALTLVRDSQLNSLVHARHIARLLETHKVTCVLDVGANLGQFRDFLVTQVRWSGPVVSFEPVKSYYQRIASRAGPTWRVFDFALGSKESTETITTFDSPGLASIRPANMPAMRDLLPKHSVETRASERVLVSRLDTVFDNVTHGLDASRIFLKIDTQGYDLEVFRGAATILERVRVLQLETSFLPIYEGASDFKTSIDEVRAAGFFVSGLFPVTLDEKQRAIDIDFLYVRAE